MGDYDKIINMSKNKLLLVVPSLHVGGQERVCVKTAELLQDIFDVTIVVFDNSDMAYESACDIININVPSKHGILNKVLNILKRAKCLRTIRRRHKTSYVYSFGPTANIVNVLSRGIGKTIIGIRSFEAVNNSIITKYVFSKCDKIICCSKDICNQIELINNKVDFKTICLYNPIDVNKILELGNAPVFDVDFSKMTIIFHGRLDPIKNLPRLIKAFSILNKEIQNTQLVIIGEGEQRLELENLIESLDLNDVVRLIGFRENPFAYLSKSTLYVLPSMSEGFPNSLLEGMAFMPVVSTDCKSGPREILYNNPKFNLTTRKYEMADYGILVNCSMSKRTDIIDESDRILASTLSMLFKDKKMLESYKRLAYYRVNTYSCDLYKKNFVNFVISD